MPLKPALLGNTPAFAEQVSIVRPLLPHSDELLSGIQDMLTTGKLTAGQYLERFEVAVADHLGTRHALAVSSCTTGLMLTYRGLGLTGEVIVPSFTFMATVSALVWAGLKPVFADVDVHTATLNPAAVEAVITPRTSAIVAVHTFGNPADIEALQRVAERHHLKLVFDAAHGFGARYQGAPVGVQGEAQVYSLSPTKLLIAGEGGIVATNDTALADYIRIGREYGNSGGYDSAFAGFNARMSEFHALLGLRSLDRLEDAVIQRNHTAELYRQHLSGLPGIGLQTIRPGNRCSYKDLSITIDGDQFGLSRDELALALAAENIDTRKYYHPPVHRQTAYRQFASPGVDLTCTEQLAAQSLSLPLWSHMDERTVQQICQAIERNHAFAAQVKEVLRDRQRLSAA